jgi:hypothetical protein
VRITQPELNAIAKARGITGDVEGFINKFSGKGPLTAEQKRQLTQLMDDVADRIRQKQAIANDALDRINSAGSRDEIVRIDSEARRKLGESVSGSSGSTGAKTVTGGGTGAPPIPNSIPAQFRSTAHYSPSQQKFYYTTDGGKTWLPAPAQ